MGTLLSTLLDYDPGLLIIIAHRWDVDLDWRDKRAAVNALAEAMLDPGRAALEWSRLNDTERGALQMVLAAPDHRMPESYFSRLFGEIRPMGPGKREREKPHLAPANVAEVLYYRGLLAREFHQGKAGLQPFVCVPADLAEVLPVHETGFDLREQVGEANRSAQGRSIEVPGEPEHIIPARTTLVDDLTTLLAYAQVQQVPAEPRALMEQITDALQRFWLSGQTSPGWIGLIIGLAAGAGLASDTRGMFKPVPAQVKRWLDNTRPQQVRSLAETWRSTAAYNELWHTPGLHPEDTGWRNDPVLARQTVLTYLEMVPPDDWWSRDELVALVKESEPDFQRPGGDFESWYIRDAVSGEYLRGFEHWDRVDGAVLRFILNGPLHWLGLVDLANDGTLCRLTVYGRALCGETEWPDPPEDRPSATIQPDGTILVPRTVSRYERFQLARITEWRAAGDPYVYALTAAGLAQAAQQGLQPAAIRAFVRRMGGGTLPEAVERMLDQWDQAGQAGAWMSRAVILRTETPALMQTITEAPELRRYLGAALGPTAVIVRAGQEDALASALQQHGILVEFDE